MELLRTGDLSTDKVIDFFSVHWGSPEMVISSGVYDCSKLDGFAYLGDNREIIGLITYITKGDACEIISLDSIKEGRGIGSALIKAVENGAVQNQCKRLTLITTNDNLKALAFYQKRGFSISGVYKNAVEKARMRKPEIPLVGNHGIPIRDEIELEKML
ncbi:GNAT family N-acetyltransferase [Bacillus marinisedimentorum]|uniref:GNAT family N-acetyltransferase n=1 Tax=Bacillus marinisedimentorum TaxID=1821260 RepID=UPI0007E0A23C|nr:GNAT family N-acetyltransferase [Bacillus marinisedimentorum]